MYDDRKLLQVSYQSFFYLLLISIKLCFAIFLEKKKNRNVSSFIDELEYL